MGKWNIGNILEMANRRTKQDDIRDSQGPFWKFEISILNKMIEI